MTPELLRALIALGLIALGGVGYLVVNRWMLKRGNRARLGLEGLHPNTPAVLYFTTPYCAPCRTTQRPALARLQEITGGKVQLIQVDALEQPELAESWGVLSVPTTFVIDSKGQARRVNHGIASAEKLLAQLEEVEGRSLGGGTRPEMRREKAGVPGTD